MFNRILEQVTGRFGLSQDKAKRLLGMLVAQIFNPKHGGPAGFLQSFRDQGLGDTVDSWLGQGPNQPISAAQLEGVLGADTLNHMSAKLDVPTATVSGAAAAILPDAINELSEHGDLPDSVAGIPGKFGSWFGNLQDHLDDFSHWSTATAGASAAALGASVGVVGNAIGHTADASGSYATHATGPDALREVRPGPGKWLQLLLLAAAVVVAILLFRSCQQNEATAPVAPATTADTPAAQFDSAAAEALDRLTPGKFSADDLVKALNLMIIHFDTGSANISARSDGILSKAAEAIKAAPAGTRIEVGGHTDNIGNAASNQRLSQQRADAVKARLVQHGVSTDALGSQGYGQDKPVADNGSEDGRAKNRRIEFTVQK